MGLRPNVVVGAVGAVVFLVTGSLIVTNWRELTGLEDWAATVRTDDQNLLIRMPAFQSGQERTHVFNVTLQNVTAVSLRATWSETGLAQHEVTLTLSGANDCVSAAESGQGGDRGISIEEDIAGVPAPRGFTATDDAAKGEFEKRYPVDDDCTGFWTIRMRANNPNQVGSGTVRDIVINVTLDYYVASFGQVERGVK